MDQTAIQRFECKFTKSDGCWNWTASTNDSGYGLFHWLNRRMIGAHRAAWQIYKGPIPEGLQILHRCDNRRCVNPGHLFLGTNADNVADKLAKGRGRTGVGSRNRHAVLSEEDALQILRDSTRNTFELAEAYGVTPPTIQKIKRGELWKHLGEKAVGASKNKRLPRGAAHHKARLTEAQVIAIRADTRSDSAVAKEFGIGKSTVSHIRLRLSWKHIGA